MEPQLQRGRWSTLPPGYVAQPVGGGEHDGTKWMLNRVYDPRGRLDHDRTYWEVSDLRADDQPPRSVSFGELGGRRIAFSAFCRTTPPLQEIEGWLGARKRAAVAPTRERPPIPAPRHAPTPLPS